MSDIGWNHPVDENDETEGFNDSGIYTFNSSQITSLGREITQNSLDEVLDETKPLSLKFVMLRKKTKDIPDFSGLRETFELCGKTAEGVNERAGKFFKNGLSLMGKANIPVLCVADFNTKGMRGPCVSGTNYHAFMKATGEGVKSSQTAGGSYGIGKNAPYAVSELRTIIVSTAFLDNEGLVKTYFQAKSILMSHSDGENTRRAKGYWGVKKGCKPIEDPNLVPDWLHRPIDDETGTYALGTSLFILGFNEPNNWQERLTASILSNFFGSICAGKLEVEIDG
jgi:hypothetical protein